jgi:hypothetical protein
MAKKMPVGKHEHITEYDLETLKADIMSEKLFGFIQVDIKTPDNLKDKFSEMTPIFKNAVIKEKDISDFMRNEHKKNNKTFHETKSLVVL